MLIPLYPKIRLPFLTILGIVFSFDSLINELRQHNLLLLPSAPEWDIYLTNVNALKTELQTQPALTGEYRRKVLTGPMPRFIWRATALLDGVPALDLLFDATDIEQGPSFVGVIEYNTMLGQILRSVSQALQNSPQVLDRPDRHVLSWLAQSSF
jgi:hypothetical protein